MHVCDRSGITCKSLQVSSVKTACDSPPECLLAVLLCGGHASAAAAVDAGGDFRCHAGIGRLLRPVRHVQQRRRRRQEEECGAVNAAEGTAAEGCQTKRWGLLLQSQLRLNTYLLDVFVGLIDLMTSCNMCQCSTCLCRTAVSPELAGRQAGGGRRVGVQRAEAEHQATGLSGPDFWNGPRCGGADSLLHRPDR